MTKYEFRCKDIGMNCGFEAHADTKEQLMPKIAEHAKNSHGIEKIPDDLRMKVEGAIKKKMF